MSSKQRHRGQHANDRHLFSKKWLSALNYAVADYAWLLSRGYGDKSSLKLVGDRYRLSARQRQAVYRASCTDSGQHHRQAARVEPEMVADKSVLIDGYNLLITIEAALSSGIILLCRDGCHRDIASVHGTYRKVAETIPALSLIGQKLVELKASSVHWLLDRPVSNSGMLKSYMLELAAQFDFSWSVELVNSPDKTIIAQADHLAISSDGWILDNLTQWFDLAGLLVADIPQACIMDLRGILPPTDTGNNVDLY